MGAALGTLFAAAAGAISYAFITAAEYTAAYAALAGAYIANSAVAAGLITQTTAFAYELGAIGVGASVIYDLGAIGVITSVTTTTITPLGAAVFGTIGATAILGIGGGIINAALGSGNSLFVPTQPSYDQLISGKFCALLEYVNYGCRMLSSNGDQRTVRVQAGQKRSRPVQSTSEEVLLSR